MGKSASIASVGAVVGLAGCLLSKEGSEDPEDYPSDDITVVITAAEGGPTDAVFRGIQSPLEDELGTSLISDQVANYRTGAGSGIGLEYLWDQEPTGYTICVNTNAYTTLKTASGDADVEPTELSLMSTLARSYIGRFAPADEWDSWDDFVGTATSEEVYLYYQESTNSATQL